MSLAPERETFDIDNWDPSVPMSDPYPFYKALNARDPVYWLERRQMWVVTSYPIIREILADPDNFRQDYERREQLRSGPAVVEQPYYQALRRMFFMMDGADHARLRPLFAKWFMGPTRTRDLIPRVEASAKRALDDLEGVERFDLIRDFAHLIPLRVICEIMGVPDEEALRIAHDLEEIVPIIETVHKTPEVKARADKAMVRLQDYFDSLIAERRRNLGDDLLSAMIRASEEGAFRDEAELHANILLMYLAGHETTTSVIGLSLLTLFRNPDVLDQLRRSNEITPAMVEELLRYDNTSQGVSRATQRDVTLGGKHIEKGSFILCLLAAANRDPSVFPDPDRLILDRDCKNTLSFGYGAHFCIGNMLARAEVRIALSQLLARRPNLQLETADPPSSWFKPSLTRALLKLPAYG